MPSRRLINPRPAVVADTALDVAMTVVSEIPAASRNGRPTIRVRNGTRKAPPPIPSIAPNAPEIAPAAITEAATIASFMRAEVALVHESATPRLSVNLDTDRHVVVYRPST